MKISLLCGTVILLAACDEKKTEPPASAPNAVEVKRVEPADASTATAISKKFDSLARKDFNQRAQEHFLPLFWRTDANSNAALDANELVVLIGPQGLKRSDFVDANGFTQRFKDTYSAMVTPLEFSKLPPDEKKRRELVQLELSQGQPTLVETDFSSSSAQDKAIITHLTRASALLETIFAKQLGTDGLRGQLAAEDTVSQSLFWRNQGPWCVAPKTENDLDCSAIAAKPRRISGLYPTEAQSDSKFCEKLAKEKNAKVLSEHFSVVVAEGKGFKTVPYHQAYATEMKAIADELSAAAEAITSDDEAAFKVYLQAAAKAFTTNDWESANGPWVAMGPQNSKWFLRIAPDEVYFEPCAWKAAFAMQLARINLDSLEWQKKLEPVKGDMEKALAALAGPPYKARDVKFKLPDFIDVVLNAGDQRNPSGATVGQSLPNWGKTAEKGGRTVAMTNLYTDADSREAYKTQLASLYCPATMAKLDTDPKYSTMGTVLHEAAHNLGPAHDYKVKGKVDDEVFGGPLASTLEELKAQTASMYFVEWLAERKIISRDEAERTALRDVAWAFGHISRGMYDGGGKPKNYSQLAAIQLGELRKAKVLEWKKDAKAANDTDLGCFEVDLVGWRPAVDALAKRVLSIKASGNRKDAEVLIAEHVDAKDEWGDLRNTIATRWLRAPKATFVYAITQ